MAKSNSSRNQETAIGPIYYTQHHPHGLTVAGLRGGRGSGHIATQSDSLPRAFRANSAIRCSESGYRKNIFVVFNSATRDSHQNTSDDAATSFALVRILCADGSTPFHSFLGHLAVDAHFVSTKHAMGKLQHRIPRGDKWELVLQVSVRRKPTHQVGIAQKRS